MNRPKLVLAIPHSSTVILSGDLLASKDGDKLQKDANTLCDTDTDKLFQYPDAKKAVFPYSRFSVDVEKYWDDTKEVMAPKGFGKFYNRFLDGSDYPRNITDLHRVLYFGYHGLLKQYIEDIGDGAVLVDCHSFGRPREIKRYHEFNDAPDFCIGFNEDTTKPGPAVLQKVQNRIEDMGYTCKFNHPFSGSITVETKTKYTSIMIEVNQKIYLSDNKPNPEAKSCIQQILDTLERTL